MPSKTPRQPIDLASNSFNKLAFNRNNEKFVREVIFAAWRKYFVQRRRRELRRLAKLAKENAAEAHHLRGTKFVRYEQASDLSGACKICAQVAHIVFPLTGEVISNKHHTFVVLLNGEIYDMNRNCRDVRNLSRKGRPVYGINLDFSASDIARKGRESWHELIQEILEELNRRLVNDTAISYASRQVKELPAWAKPVYPDRTKIEGRYRLAA